MKSKIIISIIVIFTLSAMPVVAQEFAPVGTAVAQFLEIGIGARAAAMGEAYTALADDAGSVFWNPAGVASVSSRQFYLGYTSWPADISIGGLALAWNIESVGTFAVNAVYLDTDDMPVTTVYDPEGTSGEMFSLTNYAFGLTYARNMTDQLSFGITGKYVSEDYFGYGYSSWALDLGTVYHTGYHGLNLAMAILHFGPEVKFSGNYIDYSDPASVARNEQRDFENYSLPITFRFGVSMNAIEDDQNILTVAADMVHPNNNLEQYNLGLEYGLQKMFFVRAGYQFNTDERGIALGLGVRYNISDDLGVQLDYAYSDMGVLSDIHRVNFGFGF